VNWGDTRYLTLEEDGARWNKISSVLATAADGCCHDDGILESYHIGPARPLDLDDHDVKEQRSEALSPTENGGGTPTQSYPIPGIAQVQ
jgi:hypothetical protein